MSSHGQITESTRATTKKTKSMATECLHGQMEGSTKVFGQRGNKKAWVSTIMRKVKSNMEGGLVERGSAGYRK